MGIEPKNKYQNDVECIMCQIMALIIIIIGMRD